MADGTQSQVHRVFEEARHKPPEEQRIFVDQACAGDDELKQEVESMLARGSTMTSGDLAADDPGEVAFAEPIDPMINHHIRSYHIKRVIAVGGMGKIYEAVQDAPRRAVAVKVLKHGVTSSSTLRRFTFESQILARLRRHPGIAQIYEAGTWGDSHDEVPFFAMEYIPNARDITEYAKYKKLNVKERLKLFAKVCDAVHHGHQNGIIHRDLKPGNILVDSTGQPKVIDFGVARATDSDMAVTTMQTDVGQLIGTLQYMSPEQCDADPHDIDTRSDVYALGVVLYELLCDRLPYNVGQKAVYEATRMIKEQAPAPPSTINRVVRSDIETITLKAMEKDRDRRYRSAAELGDDIRRYLHDEPILARPPSIIYQMRVFARRNKAGFAMVATIVVGLVLAITGTSYGWSAANRAEDTAVAAHGRADRMFRQGHELAKLFLGRLQSDLSRRPRTLGLRQELADHALVYVQAIQEDAGDDVVLLRDTAWGYRRLGEIMGGIRGASYNLQENAIESFETAIVIHEDLQRANPDDRENLKGLVWAHLGLGDMLESLGQAAHREHYTAALAISRQLNEIDGDDETLRLLAIATLEWGAKLRKARQLAEAEEFLVESMSIREQREAKRPRLPDAQRDLSTGWIYLATLRDWQDRPDEARQLYERAWEKREDILKRAPTGKSTPRRDVAIVRAQLGDLLLRQGILKEAISNLEASLEVIRALHAADPLDQRPRKDQAMVLLAYGKALAEVGRTGEAVAILQEAMAEYEALASDFPEKTGYGESVEETRETLAALG